MSKSVEDLEHEALWKEYQSLRSEIKLSIRNQVRILGYGGTVLGVFTGLGVVRPSFLIVASLPFVAFFFAVLWSIEQTRMMRAGDYISTIENRLNDEYFEEPVMLWESWLRYRGENQPEPDIYQAHYWSQYLIIAIFILTGIFGIIAVLIRPPSDIDFTLRVALAAVYFIFIAIMVYILTKVVRHKNMEKSFENFRGDIKE